MHKYLNFLRIIILILILLACVSFTSSIGALNKPEPITDKKLKQLGLDRKFHKCISVADGDTITLEDIGSIRFIGIDTPEKNHPKLPIQYWSKKASNFTRQLCLGKKVRLDYDPYDNDLRGKYGRVLGYIFLENGMFLQEELLKKGHAIAYLKYPFDEEHKAQFIKWEQMARRKRVGLWQDDGFLEARWILKQKHQMVQITNSENNKYELRYKDWILKSIPIDQLEPQVKKLYGWIYEFSVRDLEKKLDEANYYNEPKVKSNKMAVLVFGMTHKKWGIFYQKHIYPRIKPEELDRKIEQLFGILNSIDSDKIDQGLINRGYHYVGDLQYDPLYVVKIPNNKERFSSTTNIPNGIRVINWDRANEHIGKYLGVKGEIVRTHNSGKACFLNFHNNFTRYMSVVIFSSDFAKFPKNPEDYYLNKIVIIKGTIKEYKNKPEIILKNPAQIEIIEGKIPIKSINKKEGDHIVSNQNANNISLPKLTDDKEFIFYTIKPGDSLSKLAELYYGDPKKYYLIEEYNELKNSNHVIIGQKIKIPKINRSFTLNQKVSSTERTMQQNLNRSDNNKKFYYLYSTMLIVLGVIGLFYILKRGKKPYVAKKDIRSAHDIDMAESMLKRSYQPEIEKNKQTYTHNFEYDETEGCEYYIVREHPSNKIVTKEKL